MEVASGGAFIASGGRVTVPPAGLTEAASESFVIRKTIMDAIARLVDGYRRFRGGYYVAHHEKLNALAH